MVSAGNKANSLLSVSHITKIIKFIFRITWSCFLNNSVYKKLLKQMLTLHGKPYFLFARHPERMVFSKKSCRNLIFLVLSGKTIFLFPERLILPLRRKMKDDLSLKSTPKYDIFFKCSEKMVFSKWIALGHDLSCIIWKDGIFFPKTWYFFLGRKVREDLFQEIHGNMKFSVYTYRCYKRGAMPICQKNQRWSYLAKIHQKVIDILDWHSRKSSSNYL